MNWKPITDALRKSAGINLGEHPIANPVGGGCINRAVLLEGADACVFIKLNTVERLPMFEAEAAGLETLAETETVRVPKPYATGTTENSSYIAMEDLQLGGGGSDARLGRQLADLHRLEAPDGKFGWHRDNTIGESPQHNTRETDWATFWRDHRIGVQFEMLKAKGIAIAHSEKLLEKIPAILAGHLPHPAPLHGDLWGGNAATDSRGRPVIFDPAFYYGDRETDLAMTRMFGGFSEYFYLAYQDALPLPEGHEQREILYSLYPILNHALLFGEGYVGQAEVVIIELLSR